MEEVWRPVKGYEGYYEVSSIGSVYSVPRVIESYNSRAKSVVQQRLSGRNMKLVRNSLGYDMVCLSKNGIRKVCQVHRLVAEAFIDNPENKPFVDHINTIPYDNRVENLRWVDSVENSNNDLTVQHTHGFGYNSQFRKGFCPSSNARANKKNGIGVYSYDTKVCLSEPTRHGAFIRISKPDGNRVCDFGVSYDSLVSLKDEIEEYLKDTKRTSI